jgi:surface antigen
LLLSILNKWINSLFLSSATSCNEINKKGSNLRVKRFYSPYTVNYIIVLFTRTIITTVIFSAGHINGDRSYLYQWLKVPGGRYISHKIFKYCKQAGIEEKNHEKSDGFVGFFVFSLAGCTQPMGSKEGTGTLLGATAGAILGSNVGKGKGNVVAIAIGTLAGALFGQEIGRSLDRADRITMGPNSQYSLEHTRSHQTTRWNNPDSSNSGSMMPTRTYQQTTGQYCREYSQTVVVAGKKQDAYGTACRQPDGSWIVNN